MLFDGRFNSKKNVEKISCSFQVENNEEALELKINKGPFQHIPIILENSKGEIKLLTSFKTFQKEYIVKDIEKGSWNLKILKPYLIDDEFEITIEFGKNIKEKDLDEKDVVLTEKFLTNKKWYKGELHNHTRYSDGQIDFKKLKEEILKNDLDFIFPTEHNLILKRYPKIDIPVIPSTELTLDDKGHFNFFGLKRDINYFDLVDEDECREESLKKIFKEVKNQGGLISLNHPFHNSKKMCLGLFYNIDLEDLDFIEVINSPTEPKNPYYDKKALEAWDLLLNNGYKVFAVSGSDNHGLELGDPLNYIKLEEYSSANILESLKSGKLYVSRVGELKFLLKVDEKEIFPGEDIEDDIKIELEANEKLYWKIIKDGRVTFETYGKKIEKMESLKDESYFRIEAVNENHEPMVVVNPIFKKGIAKERKLKKWFEVKNLIWRD